MQNIIIFMVWEAKKKLKISLNMFKTKKIKFELF